MKIIRTKRKTIALIVELDGSLTVRAPQKASKALIERFIQEKSDWIQSRQELARQTYSPPHRYEEGETFFYLGKGYPLKFAVHPDKPLALKEAFYLDKRLMAGAEKVFQAWYRRQARQEISVRLEETAARLGYRYTRLRITSARTRWGSCSNRGTLSFTWRLVMAPPEAIRYVIIHELVHLEFPNHSREFWARVGTWMPDYQSWRKWLKQNGARLGFV